MGERRKYDDVESFVERIVGHRVAEVDASDDSKLRIVTDKGMWTLEAEGDCCSHSYWYADAFEGLDNLIGQVVTSAEDRDDGDREEVLDEEDTTGYGGSDCRQTYALVMNTANGTCVLEMRNDSNGYYGGSYNASFAANA